MQDNSRGESDSQIQCYICNRQFSLDDSLLAHCEDCGTDEMLASFLDDAGCMMESFVEDKISVSFFENTNLDDVPVGEEIRARVGNKSIVKVGKMENWELPSEKLT